MRKRIRLLGLLMIIVNILTAQDIIYKKNGEEISANILEITIDVVKYKKFDQSDGPIRNINKSEVFMIIYQDGTREKFESREVKSQNNDILERQNNQVTQQINQTVSPVERQNEITLQYLSLKIEKAKTVKSFGTGMIYVGGIAAAAGLMASFKESESAGLWIAGGGLVWITGIIMRVSADSRIRHFEKRKYEISFTKPTLIPGFQTHYCSNIIPQLNIIIHI